ncbi:bifunctional folylpolyglutamate synthase/dihydrofolate synthase [Streptococcus porcinus]
MLYEEALEWIHGQTKFGIRPGLKRVFWVLEKLGNPQNNIFGIHVVGTNGKGSTVNNLQRILTASSYDVGTFTSPFIMDFRERISVNGHMISKTDLVICCNVIKPLTERIPIETELGPITEFEIITIIMFYYFGKLHPVDIAIIEAGLGGLYDSTNVFKAFAIICPSIGLDHQDILGETYAQIAEQKAGVIKGGEKVLFAIDNAEARQVFLEKSQKSGSQVYQYEVDYNMQKMGNVYQFLSIQGSISGIKLAMPGQHQVANAAHAIQACQLLKNKFPLINDDAIRAGLEKNYWLGRTELMLPNLMIDGAHNKESIQALVDVLKTDYKGRHIHILVAAINTKPIEQMLDLLQEVGDLEVTTFNYPRAFELDDYPLELPRNKSFKDWLTKMDVKASKDFYVITGSLYFISEVRQFFKKSVKGEDREDFCDE